MLGEPVSPSRAGPGRPAHSLCTLSPSLYSDCAAGAATHAVGCLGQRREPPAPTHTRVTRPAAAPLATDSPRGARGGVTSVARRRWDGVRPVLGFSYNAALLVVFVLLVSTNKIPGEACAASNYSTKRTLSHSTQVRHRYATIPKESSQHSLAQHWARDWRALALTQVHHPNFTTKLPRTALGTALARTGTNTGTPREPPKRLWWPQCLERAMH